MWEQAFTLVGVRVCRLFLLHKTNTNVSPWLSMYLSLRRNDKLQISLRADYFWICTVDIQSLTVFLISIFLIAVFFIDFCICILPKLSDHIFDKNVNFFCEAHILSCTDEILKANAININIFWSKHSWFLVLQFDLLLQK